MEWRGCETLSLSGRLEDLIVSPHPLHRAVAEVRTTTPQHHLTVITHRSALPQSISTHHLHS